MMCTKNVLINHVLFLVNYDISWNLENLYVEKLVSCRRESMDISCRRQSLIKYRKKTEGGVVNDAVNDTFQCRDSYNNHNGACFCMRDSIMCWIKLLNARKLNKQFTY